MVIAVLMQLRGSVVRAGKIAIERNEVVLG